MNWQFINSGFNTGKFNMEFDLHLAENSKRDEAVLRFYRWKPYCISIGANQDFNSIDIEKAKADNLDLVKRPTGGRAILHSEELTYSVIYPIQQNTSAKNIYHEINHALLKGLKNYNERLNEVELETVQPDFKNFYKKDLGAVCFAVPAKSEIKFNGKKLVGSAQRKLGKTILQHGSIICGEYHKRIINYLKLPEEKIIEFEKELNEKTIEIEKILNAEINYEKLIDSIKKGFEKHYQISFNLIEQD